MEETKQFDIFYNHRKQFWTILGSLMVVMLLSALDQMIFSTALPTIVGELHGVSHMLWVTTAYILAATISMPLYGKLSDMIGRKMLLLIGIGIFLVGSTIGGFSHDMTTLIIARGIQGLGGGGLMILAQSVIADVIPLIKRGKYMGLIGAVFGLSSILGPLLGGFFTDHLTWRWAFWFNLPLGAVAFIVVLFALKVPVTRIISKFDVWGTVTMIISVTSLVLFTSWGGTQYDWNSLTIISLITSFVVFGVIFVLLELKVENPLIPVRLFKDRNFAVAAIAGLIVGVGMFGALAYLPTYLQIVNHIAATNSGLLLLPMMAGLILMSVISGQIVSRTGNYKWLPVFGFALVGLGLFLLSTMTVHTSLFVTSVYMFIMGAGIGSAMQILVLIIQNAVPRTMVGTATATNNFFREIGAALGGSFVGSLFSHHLTTNLAKALPAGGTGSTGGTNSLTPAVIDKLSAHIQDIISQAYNSALTPIFLELVPLMALGLVLLLFIKQKPIDDRKHSTTQDVIEATEFTGPLQIVDAE